MKLAKAVLYSACLLVVLVATWSCQDGSSNPVAPVEPNASLQSITAEARGDGRGDGSIKVDSYCDGSGSCDDADREDNTIAPGGGGEGGFSAPAIIWVKASNGVFCSGYRYTIDDKGEQFVGPIGLGYFESCGDTLRRYEFYPPSGTPSGGSESATLTVYCDDDASVIGSDSFRLVDNDSCYK